mmetsp:Transcript_29684/g.63172  ORF Transcript_29684/g.63172 Transcript_29684/m.63172 type:complete len:81 (-) Transcript_29684:34-276(-)
MDRKDLISVAADQVLQHRLLNSQCCAALCSFTGAGTTVYTCHRIQALQAADIFLRVGECDAETGAIDLHQRSLFLFQTLA